MKNPYYYFLFIISLLIGCKGETVDVSKLVAERDSLKAANEKNQQDFSSLNFYVEELATSLDSIYISEGFMITGKNAEGNEMTRDEVKQGLIDLGLLVERQRQRIVALEDSLKVRPNNRRDDLLKIINSLKLQLEAKEKSIAQLQRELASSKEDISHLQSRVSTLNTEVSNLNEKNRGLTDGLKRQSEIINTGYVIIGAKKELMRLGVLEGGFLQKKKINSSGLNSENAKMINITTFTEMTIDSKNPKIHTAMPPSSYRLIKNGNGTTTLKITDPTAFWRASNFLVISTD